MNIIDDRLKVARLMDTYYKGDNMDKTKHLECLRVIKQNGCEYRGISQTYKYDNNLNAIYYFNDPLTGSTLTMRQNELDEVGIINHLAESRERFFKPKEV